MGSSNATIDPWMFRSPIGTDSWYPTTDAFARETESALTKALQQSLFNTIPQPLPIQPTDYSSTTTVSLSGSPSGSDPETPGSKRKLPPSNPKSSSSAAAKRKSRASKRSMTTFIQADPANFRHMVQQVTGVKLQGNGHLPVVKPEPVRQPFINKLQGLLPTLDTSAYLLNHTQRLPVSVAPAGDEGTDFYPFSTFPTLESSI